MLKKFNSALIICLFFSSMSCSQKSGVQNKSEDEVSYEKLDHGVVPIDVYEHIDKEAYSNYGVATLAGGCFWCTEAAFERIEGVVDVISGYIGGEETYPSYNAVSAKQTGHAEAIQVYYDKSVIDYNTILDIFFVAHDPTQLNRQGPDRGPQYRSAIFYHNDAEKLAAESKIAALNDSGKFDKSIVTTLEAYTVFWVAEGYHQNFYELNPDQGYVRAVSRPKVEKVKKYFPELLKAQFKN